MRGKILQSTKNSPDLQIISIDDQVYLLRKDEVVDASFSNGPALKQEILDHILSFSMKHSDSVPTVLNFKLSHNDIVLIHKSSLENDPLYTHLFESRHPLQGIPAVGGSAKGAVVIWKEQKVQDLQGKILVGTHLPIKYSEVLKSISGLILENGSLLSHISILAREQNIPCIIGVKGASVFLKDKKVKMDGDSGMIKVL